MITDLSSYKIITYFLSVTLIILFSILYILILLGLLILIGFTSGFFLGPRVIGFLLLSIWGGYITAKYFLSNRLLEIKRREYDAKRKEILDEM